MSAAAFRLPPGSWGRLAPGLLLLTALLVLFRDTAAAMVGIWSRSDTFAHAYLVPPIVLWMVWRRRDTLAQTAAKPEPWVLVPMALVCMLWLLGELAGVNAAAQLALVALLVLTVPAVFGLRVAKALTFPLLFSFFAVPIGEFMVPNMMEWTADFTVAALQLSGVPVLRDGLQFVIPSGNWSVVEACSGVRYLIASFMVGTLFAYLNYRSTTRRTIFMVVSLVVPIVANWFRAYMIVMLGHLSGNTLAVGADHLIYGWVFFGIVIGLMFMLGARWTEAELPPVAAPSHAAPGAPLQGRVVSARAPWLVGATAALMLLGVLWLSHWLTQTRGGPTPSQGLPISLRGGWVQADSRLTDWEPDFSGANLQKTRTYVQGDTQVGLQVLYYRDQTDGRKLISSTNNLVVPGGKSNWAVVSSSSVSVQTAHGPVVLRAALVRGRSELSLSASEQRLRVWQVYWVGGAYVASDAKAKIRQALARLLGQGDDGAAIFIYTPQTESGKADDVLSRFASEHLDTVAATLDGVRRSP